MASATSSALAWPVSSFVRMVSMRCCASSTRSLMLACVPVACDSL